MARRVMGAHDLMAGRTCLTPGDYRELVMEAKTSDCIYLDPPYEGTSGKKDQRYFQQFNRTDFVECLEGLLERGIAFIVSLDGRTGAKEHGTYLPTYLGLTRLELDAGRSTQATLNGRNDRTVESSISHLNSGRLAVDDPIQRGARTHGQMRVPDLENSIHRCPWLAPEHHSVHPISDSHLIGEPRRWVQSAQRGSPSSLWRVNA